MKKKTASLVCYLTIIGWFIAYKHYNRSKKTSLLKFHLKQSFGLTVLGVITNLIIITTQLFVFSPMNLFLILPSIQMKKKNGMVFMIGAPSIQAPTYL